LKSSSINIKNLVTEPELQAPECDALYGSSASKEPGPTELRSQDTNHRNQEKSGKNCPVQHSRGAWEQNPDLLIPGVSYPDSEKYLQKFGKGSRSGEPAHGMGVKRLQLFHQQKGGLRGGCLGEGFCT